jgi:hypothetical protein
MRKTNNFDDKADADALSHPSAAMDVAAPETPGEKAENFSAVETVSLDKERVAPVFVERVRGYLLARKSPINLGIPDLAKKLSITEAQASDALILLSMEGAIEFDLVRIVVTVKE